MTVKIHQLESLVGSDELRVLLDIISHAAKYRKLLDELDAQWRKASEIVAMVGPAEEVLALQGSLKVEKEKLNGLLLKAKNDLSDQKRKLLQMEKNKVAELKDLETEKKEIWSEKGLELSQLRKSLERRNSQLEEEIEEVQKKAEQLETQLGKASILKRQFQEKLQQISNISKS